MTGRTRLLALVLLAVMVAITGTLLAGGFSLQPDPIGSPAAAGTGAPASDTTPAPPTAPPTPTPRPELGGTELYGYVPYWQMTDSMASYLRSSPVSTVLLFSVTARRNGNLNTSATGYRRITGAIGAQLIADAHRRNARVELVFSSFGGDRNARFFGRAVPAPTPSGDPAGDMPTPGTQPTFDVLGPAPTPSPTPGPPPWRRTVDALVGLAAELGVDGINVDVELLDPLDRPAYGEFLAALRTALRARLPEARVTVATEAGSRGVANASTAAGAGVDRLFLMGYDYHWSGSQPGASSPVDRYDGMASLRRSIDAYVDAGVPRDRILLGLPLYGMRWRVAEPDRAAEVIGKGVTWVPSRHIAELSAKDFRPFRDDIEHVEYFVKADGAEYLLTYYDSPATLRPKLALARDNGLAGAGFWALGYERGLPGYLELMRDFGDGKVGREESPPRY